MKEEHYTSEEIKDMLRKYYDMPGMISAEFAAAREIAASSIGSSSSVAQKWAEEEIQRHMLCAQDLATQNRFLQDALFQLDRRQKIILQYRFMGPADPELRRKGFLIPPWKTVSSLVSLSDNQARAIMDKTIKWISQLSVKSVIFGQ